LGGEDVGYPGQPKVGQDFFYFSFDLLLILRELSAWYGPIGVDPTSWLKK
jgi:hypothetical protein